MSRTDSDRSFAGSIPRVGGSIVEVTDYAATAIAKRFGAGPISGKIQAHVMVVER
jgi:hypothetical protein